MNELRNESELNHQLLINILRKQLNSSDQFALSSDFSDTEIRAICELAKKHNVFLAVADYFISQGINDERIIHDYILYKLSDEWFDEAFKNVTNLLTEAGIDFLPVKGIELKKYYPKPWMRMGGDIDIIIHECDKERVRDLLHCGLNYDFHDLGFEDNFITKNGVLIDIGTSVSDINHRYGVQSDFYDIWSYANIRENKHWYCLRDDMRYVHTVMHLCRHLRDGGCGINHVMDLWVLNHLIDVTDEMRNARRKLLCIKGLQKFESNIVAVSEKWFSGEEVRVVDGIEEFILNGFAHGEKKVNTTATVAAKKGKIRYKLSRIFVRYDYLVKLFPWLEGKRIMTPFFEVYRWIYLLKKGRIKNALEEFRYIDSVSNYEIKKTSRIMNEMFR